MVIYKLKHIIIIKVETSQFSFTNGSLGLFLDLRQIVGFNLSFASLLGKIVGFYLLLTALSNCSKWISGIATSLRWSNENWSWRSGYSCCCFLCFFLFLLLFCIFLGLLDMMFLCLFQMNVCLWSVRKIETRFLHKSTTLHVVIVSVVLGISTN